jgi:hypothetical protein
MPSRGTVHRKSQPNRHAHEATRERLFILGFDQQVNVIGLHRKVNDPKP